MVEKYICDHGCQSNTAEKEAEGRIETERQRKIGRQTDIWGTREGETEREREVGSIVKEIVGERGERKRHMNSIWVVVNYYRDRYAEGYVYKLCRYFYHHQFSDMQV